MEQNLKKISTDLRIDLKDFPDDVLLVLAVLQDDRQDGDAELVQHLQRGQEVVDRLEFLLSRRYHMRPIGKPVHQIVT